MKHGLITGANRSREREFAGAALQRGDRMAGAERDAWKDVAVAATRVQHG